MSNPPMIVRLFWPLKDGSFNGRLRRLFDLFFVIVEAKSPTLEIFRRIVKLVSIVISLVRNLDANGLKIIENFDGFFHIQHFPKYKSYFVFPGEGIIIDYKDV